MHSCLLFVLATLALTSPAAAAKGSAKACNDFKVNIPNVALNGTTHFPANATVAFTTFQSSIFSTDLPAFCRVQLVITTNATAGSTAEVELWLPDDWNSRSLTVGNGGFAGGSTSSSCLIRIDYSLTGL